MKLVVFDLDGTLNKTDLYTIPASRQALAERGIFDKSDELIMSTVGARGCDIFHLLLGTDDSEIGAAYLKRVGELENDFIKIYSGTFDGVKKLLCDLHEEGYRTAVCSNASERYIRMVLTALGILNSIDFIQPLLPNLTKNDTLRLLLERETPDKAVMVGDRHFDKDAAYANSIPFIGCLYGFSRQEVADADIAVEHPHEILNAVKALIG